VLVNRQFYDEPLVVPFGVSTTLTVVDFASALDRLAAGRTDVVLVGAESEPEPTVEITGFSAPVLTEPGQPPVSEPTVDVGKEAEASDARRRGLVPSTSPVAPVRALRKVLAARSLPPRSAPRLVSSVAFRAAGR
jgi:hypothetical protein